MTSSTSTNVLRRSLTILERWENTRKSLDELLDESFSSRPDANTRKAVSSLLFAFFRNKALIDALIEKYSKKKVKAPLRRTLELALAMALFQNFPGPEQSVDLSVTFVKKRFSPSAGAFANALLRRCCNTALEGFSGTLSKARQANMPPELYEHLHAQLGEEKLTAVLRELWQPSDFTFRVCKPFTLPETLASAIDAEKIEIPWGNVAEFYRCKKLPKLLQSDFFATGGAYIQDLSTSLFLSLLDDIPNEAKVADLCAAPGGKALMLAEKMDGGSLLLADRSETRQRRTFENFAKRRFSTDVKIITATPEQLSHEKYAFDIIVLDVPCSNTGVYRHRPDAAWNFSVRKLRELRQIQYSLLESAVTLLKNGGTIIYSSCSISAEENSSVLEQFILENHNFELKKEILLLPCSLHDGAYAAKLQKNIVKKLDFTNPKC